MLKNNLFKAVLIILISVFSARVWQISFFGIEAIRIGFGSLFIMLGGMMLGPIYGALIGVTADILGFLLQPGNGMQDYLPQITLINGLWGALPWYLFRWREFSIHIKDLFLVIGIPQALFNIFAMSFIIHHSFGLPLMVLLRTRFTAQIITIPVYVLVTYIILKKRESEDALIESEKRLTMILSNTPAVVYSYVVKNGEPTVTYVSQNIKNVLGFEPEDFIDNLALFKECIHPEDTQIVFDAISDLIKEGNITLKEYRFKNKEGNYRWLHDEQKLCHREGDEIEVVGSWWDITERRQIEDALKEYKERYAQAQTFAQAGTWEYDINHQSLYWSKECEEIFGLKEGEFEGTFDAFLKQVHPDDREYVISMNQPITEIREGINLDYEHRITKKDGRVCWVKEAAGVIRDKNDRPLKIVGLIMDITERKEKEKETRRQKERLASILEGTNAGTWEWNLQTDEVILNQRWAEIIGYTLEELSPDAWMKYAHPEDLETSNRVLEKHFAGEIDYYDVECRMKHKEGHWVWIQDRGKVISWTDDGKPLWMFGTHQDITERKQFEEEHAKLSIEYQTVFQSTQDAMFLVEVVSPETFRFIRNNLAHSQATGLDPKEIQGKTPEELLGEEMGSIIRANYKRCLQLNKPILYEERLDLPRGEKIWSTSLTPVLKDDEVIYIVGSSRDITEGKQMEEELIHRSQEVEQLNQHLNQEIEKAQRIHNNILPKEFPTIQGISFADFYQPAEKLGGDFYDVILTDNRLVIYLSDISGHGLDGGMINFSVKEAIDSYISLKPDRLSPASILKHLERQFRQKNHPYEVFIGIFLAVLDLETRELTYTGAGFQDAPFVRQGHGEETMLSVKGLFINSIFPLDKNNFQEKRITLTPGSTIFFNTDGLTEQGESGAFYGDRLPHVFYKNAYLPPNRILEAVVEDFRRFNNNSLQGDDDITFLILQVEPENTRHALELATDFSELEDIEDKIVRILSNKEKDGVIMGCLYELISNAMEHGNQMDPKKRVFLEITVSTEYIQMSVEDEGAGFNWRDKVGKPMELEGHTVRGRGIAMTEMLCDNLYYNDKGNRVTCVVKTVKIVEDRGLREDRYGTTILESNDISS